MATVVDTPRRAPAPLRRAAPERRTISRGRIDVVAALVCVGLAIVSQLIEPSLPSYDPFSWIVWGHELARVAAGSHLHFVIRGGPSWKPLPVAFTTVFGLFGTHAVMLWIVFARAVGFYALYLAFAVGNRIGNCRRWRLGGPIAGLLAAVGIVMLLQWLHFMFRATSEPLTVTAALAWLDWHLRGRSLWALSAGTALALMRPESSAFVALYALWCLWRLPGIWRRIVVLAELALIPAAWVVPPWLAAHKPFMSANQARDFKGNHGFDLYTVALHRADFVLMWPVIAAALAMTLIALWRREWLIVTLAGSCIAYVAIIEVMTIHGYPGLPRFFLPAGAIACVLAGAGVVRLAELVVPVVGGAGAFVVACVLIGVAAPFCSARVTDWGLEHRQATAAVRGYDALVTAVRRVGGRASVLPCRTSHAAVNHDEQPSLAWALGVPLDRIHPVTFRPASIGHPTLAFFAPRTAVLGGAPTQLLPGLDAQRLLRVRMWRVERITRHHDAAIDACVGGKAAARRAAAAAARRRAGTRGSTAGAGGAGGVVTRHRRHHRRRRARREHHAHRGVDGRRRHRRRRHPNRRHR